MAHEALEKRFGVPYLAEGPRAGQRSRFALLALGKLGGREMNYHSDLDLMLGYEGDGRTGPPEGASRQCGKPSIGWGSDQSRRPHGSSSRPTCMDPPYDTVPNSHTHSNCQNPKAALSVAIQ